MERNAKFQWIFCLLLGCATSLVAQNVANWGLTHPQPKETLPEVESANHDAHPENADTGGSGGRGWGE